jgi:hypothetical protein
MARISIEEANAWNEPTKTPLAEFDAELLSQVETQVLGSFVNSAYDSSIWADEATTPPLVRSIIAMLYVAWHYDKHYAEDIDEGNAYSKLLRATAQANIVGILDGTLVLVDVPVTDTGSDMPSNYPNDASSAIEPWESGDNSTGAAKFSMGMRF